MRPLGNQLGALLNVEVTSERYGCGVSLRSIRKADRQRRPQELKSLVLSESVANLCWPLMIDAEQVLVQLSTESRVGQSSAPDVTAARVATSLIRVEARPTRLPQLGTLDGSGG